MTLATEPAPSRPVAPTPVFPATESPASYVDWGAVIAGAVVAAALSLVLLTFGSALGLGLTSLEPGEGVSPLWLAVAAAIWLLWGRSRASWLCHLPAGCVARPATPSPTRSTSRRQPRPPGSGAPHARRRADAHQRPPAGADDRPGHVAGLLSRQQAVPRTKEPLAGYLTDTLFRDEDRQPAQARRPAASGAIVSQH